VTQAGGQTTIRMNDNRFTLSLPLEIYDELKKEAEKRRTSLKEVVRQCLKFGLVGMKLDEDPNTELLIREKPTGSTDSKETIETKIKFIW
jgi:hypothetical protein